MWSGPGTDRCAGRRRPVPGRHPAGPDRAVLAAAGPGRPGRGRGVVRLGRHRAEDRLRAGLPAAGNLALAAPGHHHHPPGRRRGLCRLRAARLAGPRGLDQRRTRRFAKWSAICSFALGMAGQVAYHLLAQAAVRAPWPVTTVVSCLPVLVLAMGTALAHMLRADAVADRPGSETLGPAAPLSLDLSAEDQDGPGPFHGRRVRAADPITRSALGNPSWTRGLRREAQQAHSQSRSDTPDRPSACLSREASITASPAQRRSHRLQRGLQCPRAHAQYRASCDTSQPTEDNDATDRRAERPVRATCRMRDGAVLLQDMAP